MRPQAHVTRSRALASTGALTVTVLVAVLIAASLSGSARSATGSARAVTSSRTLTVFAVPSGFQYEDYSDDRSRGEGHNPFGNYTAPFTQVPDNELVYGPFAGDEMLMSYNLFSDQTLKNNVGAAIIVCTYNLHRNSYCSASYQVKGSSIVGFGTFPFHAMSFDLSVTGGTSVYANAKGLVTASPTHVSALGLFANPPGLVGEAQQLTFALTTQRSGAGTHVDVYAFPQDQQYLDHNDDEARGLINNPFGQRIYPQCQRLTHPLEVACAAAVTKKASVTINEHNNGPFPGDQSVFSFKVYRDSSRTNPIGTATLTCQYYFDKNGLCNESIDLAHGTLFALGTFNFDSKQFSLAVTGGSGSYGGMSGQVAESQGGNRTEHLAFSLG